MINFILAAYGLTFILVYGKIFDFLRPNNDPNRLWTQLFYCPLCMSFHVGWFLGLLSPYTQLWNFEISIINLFCLACISSGTSYILSMIVKDDGIQIKHNKNSSF